ncbi:hypothetical protein V474_15635 [Novosphingobium barchaimii LL02]|uniref:DUF4348 domain-containing protein n=1 Tax=Novosphingobium barchaimii LL02 TaxID=1114963 RepID=A0A0J7XYM5_9SPHN|nr:hypothetical protein [Novosphingobium barchaimii]KMS56378.1 hypothetical protein V474_15635 [Novosphingobium barchaimii LL02]
MKKTSKATLLALAMAAPMPSLAATCPAKDFKGFLTAFMDDPAVQRTHVAVPLASSHVDADAQPEPTPVEEMLVAGEIEFPLMPDKAQRGAQRLETSISIPSANDREVKLAQSDGGYQLRYLFRRTGQCWTLVKMSDDSL